MAEICLICLLVKKIAPVAGTMLESIFSTCETSPIPVFEIHGSNDEVTLWDGDMQNNDGWGAYLSIPDIIDYWSSNNNCTNYENIFYLIQVQMMEVILFIVDILIV